MDILRSVLGDARLTHLGQSYGTRLGAVYAEMFPDRVRAMVLDGALDPALGTTERRLTQYAGFQRAFDLMAASCAQSPACALGTDPAESTARFHTIMRPLIDTAIVTDSGRPVTYNIAVGAVFAALYQEASWPQVLAGITEVEQGRGEILLAQRHVRRTRRRRSVVELLGGELRHQLHRRITTHPRTGREPARRRLRGCTLHGSGSRRLRCPRRLRILARRKRSDLPVRHRRRRSAEHPDDLDHR